MVDIGISTANMRKAREAFEATANWCNSIKSSLEYTLADLGVQWTGEVAQRFQQVMNQWQVDFSRIVTALQNLEIALTENIMRYEKNNQVRLDEVNSLQSRSAVLGASHNPHQHVATLADSHNPHQHTAT